jgi:DNA-binding CsgD family transcriptional regulator
MTPCVRLTPKEIQIAILVWEGLTNREIGKIVGTSEQVIKNDLLALVEPHFRVAEPDR